MKLDFEQWVKNYIDTLLEYAKKGDPESVMGKACLVRAEYALDLVQAFKEAQKRNEKS